MLFALALESKYIIVATKLQHDNRRNPRSRHRAMATGNECRDIKKEIRPYELLAIDTGPLVAVGPNSRSGHHRRDHRGR